MKISLDLTEEELGDIGCAIQVLRDHLQNDSVDVSDLNALEQKFIDAMPAPEPKKNTWTVVKKGAGSGPLRWFINEEWAYDFAAKMAAKYPGTVYHVMAAVRSVKAHVEPAVIEEL